MVATLAKEEVVGFKCSRAEQAPESCVLFDSMDKLSLALPFERPTSMTGRRRRTYGQSPHVEIKQHGAASVAAAN